MTEAMLAMPIVLLIFTGMIEFGGLLWQWNMAAKATQIGARLAAVSTPMMGTSAYEAAMTSDYGSDDIEGNAVPSAVVRVACGAGTTACDSDAISRLVTGGDGICGTVSANSLIGMCDVAPFLTSDNVRVTYSRSGLGYVGRPFGDVSTITVELRDINFDFLLLDSLVPGINNLQIAAHPVAITSEDLSDCIDGDPPC
ncbi:TadE/TadG family type IV pilus assembly protein [Cognatishimia maritima]|uniref:TadE/TadG family type IV pilus assembly protein n=1 Tax=Cognatishimia maritima TaxID=870908 RepID=UPI0013F4C55B|nr:TadE family protein [Cognatishimia maritima]